MHKTSGVRQHKNSRPNMVPAQPPKKPPPSPSGSADPPSPPSLQWPARLPDRPIKGPSFITGQTSPSPLDPLPSAMLPTYENFFLIGWSVFRERSFIAGLQKFRLASNVSSSFPVKPTFQIDFWLLNLANSYSGN